MEAAQCCIVAVQNVIADAALVLDLDLDACKVRRTQPIPSQLTTPIPSQLTAPGASHLTPKVEEAQSARCTFCVKSHVRAEVHPRHVSNTPPNALSQSAPRRPSLTSPLTPVCPLLSCMHSLATSMWSLSRGIGSTLLRQRSRRIGGKSSSISSSPCQ